MNSTDQELEVLRRGLLADRGTSSSEPPVDTGDIWDAARGLRSAGETRQIAERAAADDMGSLAWQLAAAIDTHRMADAGAESTDDARIDGAKVVDLASHRRRASPAASWWAAAALIIVAVGAGMLWRQMDSSRSDAPPATVRAPSGGQLMALLPTDGTLDRRAAEFSWSSAGEGARYRLMVTTDDLQPLADVAELTATSYQLAMETVASLPEGGRLLWRVEARLPDGSVKSSDTFVVTVDGAPLTLPR